MKFAFLLLNVLLSTLTGFGQQPAPVSAQTGSAIPLSPRIANYQIDVTLDADRKTLTGRETLTWRNTSTDMIRSLQFHLYLNAFRDETSTFMRESGGQLRGEEIDRDSKIDPYGSINIVSINRRGTSPAGSESLTRQLRFIQPDDRDRTGEPAGPKNRDDRTVVDVPLGKPLASGETIKLDIIFKAKLPKIFARTGYSRDYFLAGQWFPKIGVYEPAGTRYARVGQWNCHQFHANSEFYADYGVYDVNITLPLNYLTGATGLLTREKNNANGTKTQHWHADDVVDFAWTASPRFQVVDDQWKSRTGHTVRIRALMQPEHRHQAVRNIGSAKVALAYFDQHLGQYPFPNLTIVDPPFHGSGSAGMEYPTFITAGETVSFLPDGIHLPEIVTIHEFGHQYFMQLLASNEAEEAWLDEGFNQYYEGRIVDETYGAHSSVIDLFGYRMSDAEFARDQYVHVTNPGSGPSFGNSWQLPAGQYGVLTYMKTATWLRTLDGLVGRAVMDEIMQTYFIRWRWKHPCATNFIAIVNEVVSKRLGNRYGPDMNWFFAQVLYGDQVCDYALTSVSNKKEGAQYESTIRADRLGDMKLPVEVLVHFDNGREKRLLWDGQSGLKTFTLTQSARVDWAKVDPAQKIYVDKNLNNNSFTLEPASAPAGKYAVKLMFWIQNLMQWLAWLA